MIGEWIRFILAALCICLGVISMVIAVFGVNKLDFGLNRMHAAAIGDTIGILFVMLGLILLSGFTLVSLKLLMIIAFFWLASPVSSHLISRLEATINQRLDEHMEIRDERNKEEQNGDF